MTRVTPLRQSRRPHPVPFDAQVQTQLAHLAQAIRAAQQAVERQTAALQRALTHRDTLVARRALLEAYLGLGEQTEKETV